MCAYIRDIECSVFCTFFDKQRHSKLGSHRRFLANDQWLSAQGALFLPSIHLLTLRDTARQSRVGRSNLPEIYVKLRCFEQDTNRIFHSGQPMVAPTFSYNFLAQNTFFAPFCGQIEGGRAPQSKAQAVCRASNDRVRKVRCFNDFSLFLRKKKHPIWVLF